MSLAADSHAVEPGAAARGLYAYAITSANRLDLTETPGLHDASPLRLIRHDDIALVVSEITVTALDGLADDDLANEGRLATRAREHDTVVRATAAHAPVLPLRFGTVVVDADAAVSLLRSRLDQARQLLRHVAHHQEWGVRVLRTADPGADADAADSAQSTASKPSAEKLSGAEYLARRRQARADQEDSEARVHALLESAHDFLRPLARDSAPRAPRGSHVLADTAYLIAQEREAEFLDSLEQLAQRLHAEHMQVETSGPWPPYSFARLAGDDR